MRTFVEYFDNYSGQSDGGGSRPKGVLRTLLTVNLAFAVSFLSYGGDFGMGNTSMKIGTGASIVFPET